MSRFLDKLFEHEEAPAPSTRDHRFLDAARGIFSAAEVLVVIRYVYCGGNRDYFIFKEMSEFQKLLHGLKQRDCVVVMKSFEKVREGVVDQAFIEQAVADYPADGGWMLIGKENLEFTADNAYVTSIADLRESLQDRLGNHTCIVVEPDVFDEDLSIAAYVPDADGIVRPGAY